jgi:hypothetical protein
MNLGHQYVSAHQGESMNTTPDRPASAAAATVTSQIRLTDEGICVDAD